jgi:Putative adhesin
MRPRLALLCTALLLAAPLRAQSDDGTTFTWSGSIASGNGVRLFNMNGDVRVERGAAGSKVEVVAERTVRRGDPRTVRFEVRMRSDGDAVICALWGEDMRCTDDGARGNYSSDGWRRGVDIAVVMRVRVPDGVKTFARSTNGNVAVQGVTSDVDASTTNGDVNVRTASGLVNATTTNGSITATLGGTGASDQPMRFSTTNGSVTLYAPATLAADIDMSTTNGSLTTDFPMTISGRVDRNAVRGQLGNGGRRIVMRSTNGDISLKRSGT